MSLLKRTLIATIATALLPTLGVAQHFVFRDGPAEAGVIAVTPQMTYTIARGNGFEPGAALRALEGGAITAAEPFAFSVAVPEGNYKVTVTLGDPKGESDTTVKAELRRLMLEHITTPFGQTIKREFIVNVRTPAIAGSSESVHLKSREKDKESRAWDEKLTIEFCGPKPCVSEIDVEKVDVPTVFIIGDSTVCDQPDEPWTSWGQTLPRFFKPDIAVANHAESGEAIRSSLSAKRFDKIFSTIKTGDWLFIQFGHNDMKEKGEGIGAFTSYQADLERVAKTAQQHGAQVVLVTSMERKGGVEHDTLGDYPAAVRKAADELKLPLIDLHDISRVFYKALGPKIGMAFQDGTHHNGYGAYELSRCIVQGIRDNKLDLAKHLIDEPGPFDPAHPDSPDTLHIAASATRPAAAPLGN